MAGRVAELCASLVLPSTFDTALIQSALDRCKEVKDERFQVILELLLWHTKNADHHEDDPASSMFISSKEILLQMAEGYFLRGAQFQPDTPPMWKKACDAVLARKDLTEEDPSPPENSHALSNMVRIAASKGNDKRAAELTVRLIESYLQCSQPNDNSSSSSSKTNNESYMAIKAFVTPYKPSIKNPLDKAQQSLEDCQTHVHLLSSEETFVLLLLDVQIQLTREDIHIEQEAQHQYQQAQNRAQQKPGKQGGNNKATTSNTKPPTLSVIRDKTRNQVLREDKHGFSEESAASQLRDAYLKKGTGDSAATLREKSAALLLVQILNRSRDRARVMARGKSNPNMQGWAQLSAFVLPFLTFTKNACPNYYEDETTVQNWLGSLVSDEQLKLVETFITLTPCIEWMACSTLQDTDRISSQDLLPLVHRVLSALVDRAAKAKQEYQASSNVLKSSTEPMDLNIRELECARASVQSLLYFHGSNATDLRSHTEQAVTMAQRADKYQPFFIPYGTAFWNLLLAWSGFQQTPWAFCTAPEARLIHKLAEQSITQAKLEWGRPIAVIEQIVLDLAQADLESGLLAGGFRSVASTLYHATLKSLEAPDPGITDVFQAVLKSHCLIGLTKIELLDNQGPEKDSAAETFAQQSIQELSDLSLDQDVAPTYLWKSPNATLSFVKLHFSISRQLVADSLVRIGRSQEARKFLEDAVRDSSVDAEAAFSLGAFLLREAYAATKRSLEDANAAKMQLLKAAKLDSRKPGPFALLGIWYEEQEDAKRALGCYSKALLLDPPHPVAGRGVLRLTTSIDSAKSVIDNAIQASSPVNGWAWRALGKQKVMINGENDLGAVALLKALRCRDIDCPQSEPLSVFYNNPKAGSEETYCEYLGQEKGDAWAELAFCYRRLGRYTAAIRGYYSSMEAAGDHVTASVLCSCSEGTYFCLLDVSYLGLELWN
jgi:tetratricopeptide (TPR) repeat protein